MVSSRASSSLHSVWPTSDKSSNSTTSNRIFTQMTVKSTLPCLPPDADQLLIRNTDCISKIKKWMAANHLALNQIQNPSSYGWAYLDWKIRRAPFTLDDADIAPTTATRPIRVLIDETLSFDSHISHRTRNCYYQFCRIKAIHHYIRIAIAVHLTRAFVLPRIDYCNSVLLGLPDTQLNRLQTVLNVQYVIAWFFDVVGTIT